MHFTQEHIGCRIVYSARSGSQHLGTIRAVFDEFVHKVDVKLDEWPFRDRFVVPDDTVTLVPVADPADVTQQQSEAIHDEGGVPPLSR